LKHGLIAGTYFHIMPTSQRDGKTFVDPSAQALALEARCRWIVIDMGVIARDLAD
jgi:multisubunit Na+/H+ antiporter MnhC subunit